MLLHAFFICIATVHALIPVNYGSFLQTATYSLANQLGLFTAYGLNVTFVQVPNSTFAYANLLAGGYDILSGTIDNAVNLRFNSGQNFTVVGQLDQAPDLVLASAPEITTVQQLIGKPVIVDSPTSGYADLLQKVLSTFGLLLNRDYFFQVRSPSVQHPCQVRS
jgi:ABC-type nitrate/sulfonate/bicarbonate transport system substrate-binding protein